VCSAHYWLMIDCLTWVNFSPSYLNINFQFTTRKPKDAEYQGHSAKAKKHSGWIFPECYIWHSTNIFEKDKKIVECNLTLNDDLQKIYTKTTTARLHVGTTAGVRAWPSSVAVGGQARRGYYGRDLHQRLRKKQHVDGTDDTSGGGGAGSRSGRRGGDGIDNARRCGAAPEPGSSICSRATHRSRGCPGHTAHQSRGRSSALP
jgi:hypothetical protein